MKHWKIGKDCLSLFQINNGIMQVITMREFNANQKKYFELAQNEVVYVAWKDARLIAIRATSNEDELSEAEWQSIQRGLDDIKNGRTYSMREGESLTEFLERTEECIKQNFRKRLERMQHIQVITNVYKRKHAASLNEMQRITMFN